MGCEVLVGGGWYLRLLWGLGFAKVVLRFWGILVLQYNHMGTTGYMKWYDYVLNLNPKPYNGAYG